MNHHRFRVTTALHSVVLFRVFLGALFLLTAIIGWVLSGLRADAVDERFRSQLLRRTSDIAAAINPAMARALSFTADDAETAAFARISEKLSTFAEYIPNRGIYTLRLIDGELFFGPESYGPDDPMASPPGTRYLEVPHGYIERYPEGKAWVEGPVDDEYGTFVSGLAPVIDPLTDEVIMLIGVDILANDWVAVMWRARLPPLIAAALLMLLMAGGFAAFYARNQWSRGESLTSRHLETALTVVYGLFITACAAAWIEDSENRERRVIFENLSDLQSQRISAILTQVPETVDLLARFMEASDLVTFDEFTRFAMPLAGRGYLDALGWALGIEEAQFAHLSHWTDQQGLGPLELHPPPETDVRPGRRLFPSVYVAPPAQRSTFFGFDHSAVARLHIPLARTFFRGDVNAIGYDGEPTRISDMYVAYRAVAADPDPFSITAEAGVVFATFRLSSILDDALDAVSRDAPLLAFELRDVSRDALPSHYALFAHDPITPIGDLGSLYRIIEGHRFDRPVLALGRAFLIHVQPTRFYFDAFPVRGGRLMGISGMLATAILATFVGFIRQRHVALEREIRLRTADLREREQNLATTLNAIGDAVIVTDAAGGVTRMNPVAEAMTGWTFNEVRGKPHDEVLTLVNAKTGQPASTPVRRALDTGHPVQFESDITLIGRDGWRRQVDDSAAPIFDDQRNILGVIMVFRDVSDTYQARRILEQSERKYRSLFSSMSSGFALHKVILDNQGKPVDSRFLEVNQAFEEQTGFQSGHLVGKTLLEVMPETEPFWIETFGRVALTGLSARFEQAIWRKTDPAWAMCGLPDILHVDHGSDFTSNHLERTAISLHIRIIHSIVGRPQGRGKIERFFGTINTELLATLPGHLGPGNRAPTAVLDLPALDRSIGAFITTYNGRPHSEIGVSPRDAWVADGWLPRMPRSLEDLDTLLLTVPKNRVVQRDGIHFQGQRYLAPTLAPFVGHAVTIRYDPRDISEIRVYDRDTFICVAVDEDHPNVRLSLRDIESARRARRRELRKAINERIPTAAVRVETRPLPPPPRRSRLRTYEEDE